MSDTATELQDSGIRPLILGNSSDDTPTAADQIAELVFPSRPGATNRRFGGSYFGPWDYADNSMIIGPPTGFEPYSGQDQLVLYSLGHGEPAVRTLDIPILRMEGVTLGAGTLLWTWPHVCEHLFSKDTAYLGTAYVVATDHDAIFEHSGHRFVFDNSLLFENQPAGFGSGAGIGEWFEFQGEELGQPEVAIDMEVNFPPKRRRTVIGTPGVRARAPFKTAFSAELAALDGV